MSLTATHLYQKHPDTPYSLAIRRYLVVLPFEKSRYFFSIKSDEAKTEAEALAVARSRIPDNLIVKGTYVGPYLEHPTVMADTEANRKAAGITDIGYPPTFGTFSLDWYDSPSFLQAGLCSECGVPAKVDEQGRQRKNCDLHLTGNVGGRPPSITDEELRGEAELVKSLGTVKAAARELGMKPITLYKRMQKARLRGIDVGRLYQFGRAA